MQNYNSDPKNPELDQLLGRLGKLAGKFGILVCREVKDDEMLMKRCKDAVFHAGDFIIYLEDKDIKALLRLKDNSNEEGITEYFSNKLDRLILNI